MNFTGWVPREIKMLVRLIGALLVFVTVGAVMLALGGATINWPWG